MSDHQRSAGMGGGEGVTDRTVTASAAVTARLFAGLERLTRKGGAEQRVPLAQAPTVTALCEALGLAVGVVGLVLVNGVHGDVETSLHGGDEVSLFPPVGGG
jgi:molybdopterin converting factor small subunit